MTDLLITPEKDTAEPGFGPDGAGIDLRLHSECLYQHYLQRYGETFAPRWLEMPESLVLMVWALERRSPVTERSMQAYAGSIQALREQPC